jgi:phosphoribosylformylglycinamidine synthase I
MEHRRLQGGRAVTTRWAVIVFPGSNCERDAVHALRDVLRCDVIEVWHKDQVPDDIDAIFIPGGFTYGDALRTGALAAMSPVMQSVKEHAARGTRILGVCNGFQILVESGLLPGALMKNTGLRFRCKDVFLRVEETAGPVLQTGELKAGEVLRIPIAHGYGNYFVPPAMHAQANAAAVFRYCDANGNTTAESNPNGSFDNIASVRNAAGNVIGMMPHPERAVESLIGGTDGLKILRAVTAMAEVAAT